ncbi:asparagine synthase (glutamine-hydrolyzing) [Synechococcus sp. HJ21-Hayes]|uniref:asparagine synthase (glutamine-hydrolyzing) n=1 Tax=Synechococcus sp. HJ21-Hayes TaxID=2823736 RepID=UPI0020CCF5AF|nr:asparagine synthase (glutamine-hydrolyzing) [Synechococcus sp. HJ21-Hayes]MCP9852140.1 asparagine synthase (glutamine-hydrolyzing) [Synechococcus sp. HJ21-Hayes]
MCGLFGSVGLALTPTQQRAAINALRGRGPDSQGQWSDGQATLLHTRLAIQDLSPLGHQPMASPSGDLVLVFNGEIYNQQELRRELEGHGRSFHSHSDTEVLLQGLRQWGSGLWDRLNGIFAVAAWEPQQQRLTLARDGFGVKPLLWHRDGNSCAFGSELSAFEATGLASRRQLNPDALDSYSFWGAVTAPASLLAGVEVFPAGHWGHWTAERGWQLQRFDDSQAPLAAVPTSLPEATAAVEQALQQAVTRQVIGDVPVGLFLSGGLDSGLLGALLREQHGGTIHSVSVGFRNLPGAVDESNLAEATARQLHLSHTTLRIGRPELEASFDGFLDAIDQPSIDGFNSFLVARAAAAGGMRVAFSGLGADELFGGYGHMGSLDARALLRVRRIHGHGLPRHRQRQLIAQQAQLVPGGQAHGGPVVPLRNCSQLELAGYLQNTLLRDGDAVSMHHGLELRVPFLDRDLVQLALAIPEPLHRAEGPKTLLRCLAARRLPAEVLSAPKRGFNLALAPWLQGAPRFAPRRILGLLHRHLSPQGLRVGRRGFWGSWALLQSSGRWGPYWRWVVLAEWLERGGF